MPPKLPDNPPPDQAVKVTICPPGEAIGARDLQEWAGRRAVGKSGVPDKELRKSVSREERKRRKALRKKRR